MDPGPCLSVQCVLHCEHGAGRLASDPCHPLATCTCPGVRVPLHCLQQHSFISWAIPIGQVAVLYRTWA